MSRPRARVAGAVTLLAALAGPLALGTPLGASAQQSAEQLRARLDSLRPLLEEARTEVDALRESRRDAEAAEAAARVTVDTVAIGPMTVITPLDQVDLARELFEEEWARHFADVTESPALARTPFVFQRAREHARIFVRTTPVHRLEFYPYHSREHMTEQLHHAVALSLAQDLHEQETALDGWLLGEPHARGQEGNLYRHLATAPAKVVRSCFGGDVASCIVALDLERPEAPLDAWYTRDERRALVGRNVNLGVGRDRAERWSRCVDAGDTPSCDATLLEMGWGVPGDPAALWSPLRGPIRASLVAHALEVGGPGAWARLFDDEVTTPVAALERASGQPIETLVAGWHERMLSARPEVYAGLLPKSGLALLWILLFAALAMRSTRWRLG